MTTQSIQSLINVNSMKGKKTVGNCRSVGGVGKYWYLGFPEVCMEQADVYHS